MKIKNMKTVRILANKMSQNTIKINYQGYFQSRFRPGYNTEVALVALDNELAWEGVHPAWSFDFLVAFGIIDMLPSGPSQGLETGRYIL